MQIYLDLIVDFKSYRIRDMNYPAILHRSSMSHVYIAGTR